MRKIHSLGLVGAVALVLAAVVAPAANGAVTRVETDQFSGVASAQALDLSLLGRKLTFGIASADSAANVVANTLNQKASGIGTLLSPKTAITAAQGEKPTEGGRACFQPPLGEALAGANLPSLLIGEVACGEAITKGDVNSFEAIGTGTVASLKLNATQILKPALDVLQPLLGTALGNATPVGELLKTTDPIAKTAVDSVNGVLGSLLGQGSVVLPTLEPSQTVTNLVDRLQDSDLLRINIGNAIAKNTGTPEKFVSESIAQGGTIEVLPAFRGLGLPPLLKITTGESGASVAYNRGEAKGVGSAKNTLVRIESELLPTLGLGQIGMLQIVAVQRGDRIGMENEALRPPGKIAGDGLHHRAGGALVARVPVYVLPLDDAWLARRFRLRRRHPDHAPHRPLALRETRAHLGPLPVGEPTLDPALGEVRVACTSPGESTRIVGVLDWDLAAAWDPAVDAACLAWCGWDTVRAAVDPAVYGRACTWWATFGIEQVGAAIVLEAA